MCGLSIDINCFLWYNNFRGRSARREIRKYVQFLRLFRSDEIHQALVAHAFLARRKYHGALLAGRAVRARPRRHRHRNLSQFARYFQNGAVCAVPRVQRGDDGRSAHAHQYFNSEIHGAYKQLEDRASDKLLHMLPPELEGAISPFVKADADSYEYKLVKAADKLSAYVKCLEEQKSGNAEFKKAKESIEAELKARDLPCLQYFMENFIPGFLLTLDEMDSL